MVSYVDAVVAVTVMRVLLFVLHVCLLREEVHFIETHDSYKKLRQKCCLYNYEIVHTV